MVSQDLSELIHHGSLMLHERVHIAVERNHRILVPEDFAEGFDIHPTFDRPRGECVTEGMKAAARDAEILLQQLEASLIGSHGQHAALAADNIRRIALLFHLAQDRKQLFGEWNHAAGMARFGRVRDAAVDAAFIFAVVAGSADGQLDFSEVDVAPFERQQLADAQTGVEADHNAAHLHALIAHDRLFQQLLLCGSEAFDGLFLRLRAFELVHFVAVRQPQQVRSRQRALYHGDDGVDRIGGKPLAGFEVTALHQLCDVALDDQGREGVELVFAQLRDQVLVDDLGVASGGFCFCGRDDVVCQPVRKPVGVSHVGAPFGWDGYIIS